MPVCPFCQADLLLPNLPCPACGKRMRDHPSLAGGNSYSAKPAARGSGAIEAVQVPPADDAPELELSTRHAPKPPAKAPSLPPAAAPKKPTPPRTLGSGAPPKAGAPPASMPGVGGAVFDEDDIFSPGGGGGAAIELDMAPGGPGTGLTAAPAGRMAPTPPASMPPVAKGPAGRSLAPVPPPGAFGSPVSDEHAEARALADYGESPTSFWQAPLYAYRVKTRQSELRRQLAERRSDLARAQKAEEQAKLAFAERARPVAERLDGYSDVIAPITKAEKVMMQRDVALAADVEAHKARLAVIDERVQGLAAELEVAKSEEREIESKLAEADGIRQRAEAKLKRAEIEIRNANSVAEASGVKPAPARRAGSPP